MHEIGFMIFFLKQK